MQYKCASGVSKEVSHSDDWTSTNDPIGTVYYLFLKSIKRIKEEYLQLMPEASFSKCQNFVDVFSNTSDIII